MQLGVDEAGKGPVLGSMFAACVRAAPENLPGDVADSKRLTGEKRETLAASIRDCADAVSVVEIPVERIDDPDTDMNGLTVAAHARAIEQVCRDDPPEREPGDDPGTRGSGGNTPTREPGGDPGTRRPGDGPPEHTSGDGPVGDVVTGYLDAADTDAGRFQRRVDDRVAADVDLRAAHGADETYPIVGAASIVAKVERDAHVAALADEFGAIGSGYPGDATTREFLETFVQQEGKLPPCARRSWQTSQDVLAAVGQSSLGDF
jgi:ribonuclease HII